MANQIIQNRSCNAPPLATLDPPEREGEGPESTRIGIRYSLGQRREATRHIDLLSVVGLEFRVVLWHLSLQLVLPFTKLLTHQRQLFR